MEGELFLNIVCAPPAKQNLLFTKDESVKAAQVNLANAAGNKSEYMKAKNAKMKKKINAKKHTSLLGENKESCVHQSAKDNDDSEQSYSIPNKLKFENDEPLKSQNPLQIGMSAKQHASQQSFLEVMGEPVVASIEPVFSNISWADFAKKIGLHSHLLSMLINHFKLEKPTAIQVSAIEPLCRGRDCLIKAQTGSGKTFSYAIPLMQYLINLHPPVNRSQGPLALIVLPTRELATQTTDVFTQLGKACVRIVSGCLIGGTKRKSQKASLRKGLNIIVSTPQRLLDHIGKTSSLSLKRLQWLIIDEADRLVELGFERNVRRIIDRINWELEQAGRFDPIHTALLSATLTPGVESLAGLALRDPVHCEVNEQVTGVASSLARLNQPDLDDELRQAPVARFSLPSGLKQFVIITPCKQRIVALAAFLLLKARYNKRSGKLIVFFATQDCVDFHYRLFSETLCDKDDEFTSPIHAYELRLFRLHGNMDHKERYPVFQAFADCPNGVLLTTDVASRGLDLAGVAWVVQYHVSGGPVDYVHRVGRTARAGGRGKALLVLQPEEVTYRDLLASTVGVHLQAIELSAVLQAALFHLENTSKIRGIRKSGMTVEDAAATLSRYFLSTVAEDSELTALAEKAYLSFLRAYASFAGEMRAHFTFKRLHLGHMARAFCLDAAPSDIAAKVAGRTRGLAGAKSGKQKHSRSSNDGDGDRLVKKSRRLEFESDIDRRPKRPLHKHKPAELATKNMLAEYGL